MKSRWKCLCCRHWPKYDQKTKRLWVILPNLTCPIRAFAFQVNIKHPCKTQIRTCYVCRGIRTCSQSWEDVIAGKTECFSNGWQIYSNFWQLYPSSLQIIPSSWWLYSSSWQRNIQCEQHATLHRVTHLFWDSHSKLNLRDDRRLKNWCFFLKTSKRPWPPRPFLEITLRFFPENS